jgi:putative ATP-dependent DNA ligase
MDDRRLHARLDSTTADPAELFEHFERRTVDGRDYRVLPDPRHGVERGTAVFDDGTVVRGYPSVPRILVLDPGVRAVVADAGPTDRVVVEEKLDGFNVRVADVDGHGPLAFTRSGLVCPYTTDRVRDLLDLGPFFDAHPDAMLCAELVGPESPYTAHDYGEVDSHAVRVFGVRDRETGDPLPVAERRAVCETHGFPQPRSFGVHDPETAVGVVRDAIADLDTAGREGVVLKTPDGEPLAKYTTESQHHADLAHAFSVPFDYGRDFLFARVLREAFQAAEFDEDDDRLRERAHGLGEAILLPFVETVRAVADGERAGTDHTVRGDPESVAALLDHLRDQSLTLDVREDRREDGERVLTFRKVSTATTDSVDHYLDGGTYDE